MNTNQPEELPETRNNGIPDSDKRECSEYNCYGHSDKHCEDIFQTEYIARASKNRTEEVSEYVEIEFFAHRKLLYCNTKKISLAIGDKVIVETESGEDIGSVYNIGKIAKNKVCRCDFEEMPEFDIIRIADDADIEKEKRNTAEQPLIIETSQQMAESYGLELKIIAAEWQYDRRRLTVSFSAPHRVDFRRLVKELAGLYRTRIELRQISTREEAKRLGPIIGPCGRTTCCSTFLHNFNHITLDHAKAQQLSNNISKLSGNCVRLKCCLKYEYEMYSEAFEKYPPIGAVLDTEKGPAKILKVDIFKDITTLFHENDRSYEYITFEELEKYIKDEKVYVPKDADLEAQKLYNPLSEFPEDEPEEIPKDFYEDTPDSKQPGRNQKRRERGQKGRRSNRPKSGNRHNNKPDKKHNPNGKTEDSQETKKKGAKRPGKKQGARPKNGVRKGNNKDRKPKTEKNKIKVSN